MELITKFENVVAKHSDRELEMLTENILEHGVLDAIKVWGNVIIDGHARYHICKEYGIPFETKEMNFNSEGEAIIWIIKNQLGRRNLTPFQRCEMVLKFEPEIKVEVERRRRAAISVYRSTGIKSEENSDSRKSMAILADMAGVSRTSMNMVRKILEIGDEETKRRVRAGEISIHFAYNSLLCKYVPASQSEEAEKAEEAAMPFETISQSIRELIAKVSDGSASPKVIVEELEAVLNIIEQKA